jgi:hypothetical protein
MNPYLFIVGCPRSGTTLLQRLLASHPQMAITPETHWIARWFHDRTGKGITPAGRVSKKLLRKLAGHPRFAELGVRLKKATFRNPGGERVDYARFVSSLFDLYGKRLGKAIVGDKTPGYAREIPTLHGLWPAAKFVHLIRDGRDVCLSIMSWDRAKNWGPGEGAARFQSWADDPLGTGALWWEWHVRLAREVGAALGAGLYHEVRYEALVAQPGRECRTLCEFLEVPYDEVMLHGYEERARQGPGPDAKHPWMPITLRLRDWASQMAPPDVERFEALAGDLLDMLDYRRAFAHPQLQVTEAARARHTFATDARAQGYAVPAAWERSTPGKCHEL